MRKRLLTEQKLKDNKAAAAVRWARENIPLTYSWYKLTHGYGTMADFIYKFSLPERYSQYKGHSGRE